MELVQGGGDAAFNNISATPQACVERQLRFYRFLNDYLIIEPADAENSSQASTVSGTLWDPTRPRSRSAS